MDLLALKPHQPRPAAARRDRPLYAAVPSTDVLADQAFLAEWASRRQWPVVWWDGRSVPGWLVAWFVRPRRARTRHLRSRQLMFRQRLILLTFRKRGRKATPTDARQEIRQTPREKIRLRPHQRQVH